MNPDVFKWNCPMPVQRRRMLPDVSMCHIVSGVCLVLLLLAACPCPAAVETVDLGGDQFLVRFTYSAVADTKTVHVAGSFNGWDPHATVLSRQGDSNLFVGELPLSKGRYEYKFVVDDREWRTDADNPHRAPGYQNSILFAGVSPADSTETTNMLKPVHRASPAAHPAELSRWAENLVAASGQDVAARVAALFGQRPLPWITDDSVTFVYYGACSAPPAVRVFANGARLTYALEPLVPAHAVYALTLARKTFPERWAYLLVVPRGDRTEVLTDPHGWSVTSRAGRPATRGVAASDGSGRIECIANVQASSEHLAARDIYVYLPPGYQTSDARFPVLYMHDGQNCWDDPVAPFGHGGWNVNFVADKLIAEGKVKPFIVVGVSNTPDRMTEYGPGANILSADHHAYIRFLTRDLKPLIDKRYRTLAGPENTALLGSSLGGAISLQTALLGPDVFGAAACMSPALMFRDDAGLGYSDLVRKVGKCAVRWYVDSGTAGDGRDGVEATWQLIALLHETGWSDGAEFLHFTDDGALHNERAWRARLHRPLIFLFGK